MSVFRWVGALGFVLGIMFVIPALMTPGAPKPPFDPTNPATIVNGIDSDAAHAAASLDRGTLSLKYSIQPWMLTGGTGRWTYFSQAKTLIPMAFTAPDVKVFCDEALAMFKDIRGNEAEERAALMCMSRETAATINWKGVDSDNLPKIADLFWLHPGFAK